MTRKPSARAAVLGLLSLLGFLTAGCVNLPANSGVSAVNRQTDAGAGSDVRVWPQGPQRGEDPVSIVEGFLQTATSDPANLNIAREYLTGDAQGWDPQKVVVFGSDETSPTLVTGRADQVQITGTVVATVGNDGTYHPVPVPQPRTPYTFDVKYNDAKGYYQIDQLPDDFGIALTQETFRADYNAYELHYLNSAAPTESMIPVPVYLRGQSDSLIAQKLAEKLLNGPPDWLDGAAAIAAPQIALTGRNAVSIGADGTADVAVKTPNYCTTHTRSACEALADEFLASFSDLASVSHVEIVDQHGAPLGASTGTVDYVLRQYHLGFGEPGSVSYYYLDRDHHAVSLYDGKGTRAAQVGPSDRRYRQLAVTMYANETIAAAVDDSGTKLYLGEPGVSTDRAPTFTGNITSLSWDALGHLWFIDQSKNTTALYRLDITQGLDALPQRVYPVGTDGGAVTVNQIAVAPDGRRVAVVYSQNPPGTPGPNSAGIGVLEGSGSGLSLDLTEAIENPVVFQWNNLSDIDWHGSESLAVLGGQQSSSPWVVSELYSDGSAVTNSNDVSAVTINPPNHTRSIEWTGSTLLAAYGDDTANTATPQQITQYSANSNTWISQGGVTVDGFSPSYAD